MSRHPNQPEQRRECNKASFGYILAWLLSSMVNPSHSLFSVLFCTIDAMQANHPPSLQQRLLHYLPDYRVLVCRECKYAVALHGLDYHLRTVHHIHRQEKQGLLDYASTLDLAPLEDIPHPDPSTPPLPSLSQTQGFKCVHCRFACASQKHMCNHVNKEHQMDKASGPHWEAKTVQTFFKRRNKTRYFVVTPTTTTTSSSSSSGSDEWTSRADRIISDLVHQASQQEQERYRRFAALEGTTQRAENSVVYLAHAQDNYPKRAILRARADSQTWAYIPVEMSYGHIRHHSLPSILAPLTSLVSKPLGKIRVTRARYVKPGNIGVECQELLPGAA
jgi:Orsellinic acid/F9775 biosynthesis cluster protein D